MDTEGRKVIRVNDIQLLRNGPFVHVAAVDVSSNAILRRVGLAKVGDRISKTRQQPKPHLIDWKDVDIEQTDEAAVRLAVPQTKLELLHPADIAELVHELSPEERAAVFDALEDDLAADTFEELHPSYQASLMLDLPDEKASEILNEMSPDDAADLLADLPDDRRQHFIAMMEKDDAEDMRELLSYPEHSAGGIMTPTTPGRVSTTPPTRRSSGCASRRTRPRRSTTSTWWTAPSTCAASSRCASWS